MEATKRELKSYKFDCGNSTQGAVGMVIRVMAESPEDAVNRANDFLESCQNNHEVQVYENPHIEYCNVYFGTLTLSDLDEEETEDVDPETYPEEDEDAE